MAGSPDTPGRGRTRPGRARIPRDRASSIIVTDDWPEQVPITEAELSVITAYLGDLVRELFVDEAT